MSIRREELALTVDVADWDMLRAHLERGGLIVVDRSLDIVDAALAVTDDDAMTVRGWIDTGKLSKPTADQISLWDTLQGKSFQMLIASPYVLIQEKPSH
jgi:hypothetical protein